MRRRERFATRPYMSISPTSTLSLSIYSHYTQSIIYNIKHRWCSIFNADLALSVTMTAISTLLSVILMPANLLVYSKFAFNAKDDEIVGSLDFNSLFIALTVVISAIGLGLFASAKVHSYKFNIYANKLGNYAGIALVLFSAWLSTGGDSDAKIWNQEWQFYVGVMMPCLGGLLIANIATSCFQLQKPERV